MSGALTERDFVDKLQRAGFGEIEVLQREPIGIDDLALYPLFDDELLALMRRLIAPDKQGAVGVVIVVRARCRKTGSRTRFASSLSGADRALA